ncbi:MAG: FtsX-like permease family protein, partial [Thermoprotei archaeon]|nr:FtsX-like permease family protein [Thermoprotei archaeon]
FYAYVIAKTGSLVIYFGQKMESLFSKSLAFLVPIIIVGFNVAITMYSIIYERRREIYLLFALGLNPAQIALLFLAESMIYGLLGGGIGYISGLTTFRVLSAVAASKNLIIKEKLEWYWSVISVVVAIIASMIASFRPAMQAAYMYVPSMIKKIKATPEVRERRKEEITKITTEKTYGYDLHISLREAPIFFSYIYSRLQDLMSGYLERIEDIRELKEVETPSGKKVKEFHFRYIIKTEQGDIVINNILTITKMPGFDYYMVELKSKPAPGLKVPVKYLDRVATYISDVLKDWERERKLMGIT